MTTSAIAPPAIASLGQCLRERTRDQCEHIVVAHARRVLAIEPLSGELGVTVLVSSLVMRERFEAVITAATGREVIGFMSGNQQDPDIMCEVFILAANDLLDDDESGESSSSA